jgi:hypothetical protein
MFDSPELRHLWNKARAALTRDPPPEDPKKTFTLEVRPEEVKVLYARTLALQSCTRPPNPRRYWGPCPTVPGRACSGS